ncbi:MAG: 1-(5-phosphoribosyl)-5-[(5-phosphoribosylamino) methylideneamino]imidazole-4-carboxamide isomerase [Spirochaetales bacterium]
MVIIPAIDLLDGSCVRLHQGDYGTAVRYSRNPVEQAKYFADLGVRRIHIVDLNAAKGQGNNRDWIRKIRQAVPCLLEVGGGIREAADVEELLEAGVQRLVLGTVFVRNPDIVAQWVSRYGGRFLAGIDARGGIVRVSGWQEGSSFTDTEAAILAREMGMLGIIYTNIDRDGTLQGPDAEQALRMAEVSRLPVILSGGVSSAADIHDAARRSTATRRKELDPESELPTSQVHKQAQGNENWGIVGVIVGKAYYEGKIDLKTLVEAYPQPDTTPW